MDDRLIDPRLRGAGANFCAAPLESVGLQPTEPTPIPLVSDSFTFNVNHSYPVQKDKSAYATALSTYTTHSELETTFSQPYYESDDFVYIRPGLLDSHYDAPTWPIEHITTTNNAPFGDLHSGGPVPFSCDESGPSTINSILNHSEPDTSDTLSFSYASGPCTSSTIDSETLSIDGYDAGESSNPRTERGEPLRPRKRLLLLEARCPRCVRTFLRKDNFTRHVQKCRVDDDSAGQAFDPALSHDTPKAKALHQNAEVSNISRKGYSLSRRGLNLTESPCLDEKESKAGPLKQEPIAIPGVTQAVPKSDTETTKVKVEPIPEESSESPESTALSPTSQTPPASESESEISATYVGERKRQVIDRVVKVVTVWLRSRFEQSRLQLVTKGAAGEGGREQVSAAGVHPSSGEKSASAHTHAQTASSNRQTNRNTKRKASDRQEDESSDQEEPPRSKLRTDKGKAIEFPKYACPYFRYNRAKYRGWRGCPGPGWPDVHRVKEHLYRRHRQPKFRCDRCCQPFADKKTHTDHLRNVTSCPLKPMEPIEGFDADQETRLKSRKKAMTELCEGEKWKAVFRILFPHVDDSDMPSPFYEDEDNAEPSSLSECEEYIVKEVPLRLRQILGPELDRDLSIVEEGLKRKAIDSLKTLLVEAFREFRQSKETTDTNQISSPFSNAQEVQRNIQPPVHGAFDLGRGPGVENEIQDEQTGNSTDQNLADGGQLLNMLPTSTTGYQDLGLSDSGFHNEDFGLEGLDLGFLTNTENLFGEIPIMENLLQPLGGYDHGVNVAAPKKFSDSGYDSPETVPGSE